MYACPTCGAGLVFDPKSQKLLCLSCRNKFEPENIEKMRLDQAKEVQNNVETKIENENENEYEAISYKCSHCGAELVTTDETITTFCSFCRTGTMLDRKIVKKRKPDYIIPFKITKEECEEIYINKIQNSIFAPREMIEEQEVKKIRGIYMPYWIYSYEKNSADKTKGSKYSHRSGDYEYYDDYDLTTNVEAKCKGMSHDATSNFYDRLSESIAPYSTKEKKAFSPAYLSGYYADNEDVDSEAYSDEYKKIASMHLSSILGREKEYRKYNAKPNIIIDNGTAELALFPVYFLATKNKSNDRISYAVINGQTGKIAADIPIDIKKYVIWTALISLIMFFILNVIITFSVTKLVIVSVIFNILSLLILIGQNKKIDVIENQAEDKGLEHINNKKEEIKKENNIVNKKDETTEENNRINKKEKNFSILGIGALIIIGTIIILLTYPNLIPYLKYVWIGYAVYAIWDLTRKTKNSLGYWKPIVGLLSTLIVFIFKPALDIYYYATAMFSIGLTIWSFYNIINKINILTTRKLPQLGKRGGDENA